MVSYVNDLRLSELATGEGSGTWGTTTNLNLELIGEALGYATEQSFGSDADATTTVGDGVSDPARAMYFKVTSAVSLTATRTLTVAPNTVSRVMFIENATSGSQSIAISQGSGANVTIATGKTAVVYLDGAGSGAAVVDAMAGVDPGVTDTLAEVLTAGNTTGGTSMVISSGDDVTFTGASANIVFDSSDSALEFADNAKAIFGGGSDLEIYHDGSNSYISEAGTGDLRIRGANVEIQTGGGNKYFQGAANVARLFHTDSERLATTGAGIAVTGTVTADGLSVSDVVSIDTSTGSAFSSTGNLKIDIDSDNNSTNRVFQITSDSEDKVLLQVEEGGDITFFDTDGSTASFVYDASAGLTINEAGADRDFRVESNTNANALFLNGANGKLAIGGTNTSTSAPSLDNGVYLQSQSNDDVVGYNLYVNEGVNNRRASFFLDDTNGLYGIDTSAGSGIPNFVLRRAGNEYYRFDSSGNTFNEDGDDRNFRVESDSNTHMIFVDAGNNAVAINASDPSANEFRVASAANFVTSSGTTPFNITRTGGTDQALQIYVDDASVNFDSIQDEAGLTNGGYNFLSSNATNNDVNLLTLDQTGTIFNQNSKDIDFRVESNNKANMFFIDAGTDTAYFGAVDNRGFVNIEKEAPLASNGAFTSPHLSLQAQAQPTDNDGFVGMSLATSDSDNYGFTIGAQRTTGGQGNLVFRNHFNDASGTVMMEIKSGSGIVFNDDGNDQDFRVESDSNAQALLVDAGGNFVAMGNTVKNPATGFADQHGVGIDVSTGDTQISSDSLPLELGRTSTAGQNGSFLQMRHESNVVGVIGNFNGVPYIGYGGGTGGGIMFNGLSIEPTALGASRTDGSNDIGSSSFRWNDLFLGGRVEANGVTTTAVAWQSTSNSTSSSKHFRFKNPNGNVGDIRTNGSATAYITSSDYRLKENVVVMSGATERLKQLKPSRFNFIADADTTVDGFLAHEVQAIVPEAIAGEKDAMMDEEYEVTPAVLDDDGNVVTEAVMGTRSVPDYQGIDQSKLVPLLVATIQELEARITELESN